MRRRHARTIARLFEQPVSGNIPWKDVESLFIALGAEVTQRAGSRIAVVLFDEVRIFHRPHPGPMTDKGAASSIRKWLEKNGVVP